MYPRRVMGSVDTHNRHVFSHDVPTFQHIATTASEKRSLTAQAQEQETNMTAHA